VTVILATEDCSSRADSIRLTGCTYVLLIHTGATSAKSFEVEAKKFKRDCARKGVTLSTIGEAFEGCTP
jgi:hypothetical protein